MPMLSCIADSSHGSGSSRQGHASRSLVDGRPATQIRQINIQGRSRWHALQQCESLGRQSDCRIGVEVQVLGVRVMVSPIGTSEIGTGTVDRLFDEADSLTSTDDVSIMAFSVSKAKVSMPKS